MKIVDSGVDTAFNNMEMDSLMLKGLEGSQEAILHFYEWKTPSATYGYFVDPYKYLKRDCPLSLARRSTGGGVIFHLTDLAFSALIPASYSQFSVNTMDNYHFINERVSRALRQFDASIEPYLLAKEPESLSEACCGFCMAKPTQYDVMVDGRKVAGGAQRRTRYGYLHQGSVCLRLPDQRTMEDLFNPGLTIWEGMQANSFPLLGSLSDLKSAKERLKQCLVLAFSARNYTIYQK